MSKITPPLGTQASRQASRQAETQASQQVTAGVVRGEVTRGHQTGKSEQTGEGERLASWHPVPVRLVDAVMPRLKDTELRVLLVVLRQTWGWKMDRTQPDSKGATKRRDWLSHRQLCRRTGRGSDAVSAAVASLTASGLIIVEEVGGKPLATPEERRRCLGRLYFRRNSMARITW